ncbi:hypothetical protein CTN01_14005 [Photobacterium angustum]|uniref:hypothetical protein n=1 Tax=Photobacterium angustum TaxID=661 RepID=UPI000696DD07|nr:hypothetical protein [Photobacterium angustum]PSV91666.1 hypothetical protein CTN01_14005 [Photobacterium angustum]
MQRDIYTNKERMETLYCAAYFNKDKYIKLPKWFTTEVHKKRTKRWEAEHIIPAENFGRVFIERREGNEACPTLRIGVAYATHILVFLI